MLKIKKIDHVAVCVENIDESAKRFLSVLGVAAEGRETVSSQKTDVALLPFGDTSIELISPASGGKGGPGETNEGLVKFLQKRGPGLHHVAIEVEGIESALALLKGLGVALIDETPRVGARGHKVAFIHPKATGGVLIELVEH